MYCRDSDVMENSRDSGFGSVGIRHFFKIEEDFINKQQLFYTQTSIIKLVTVVQK